MAHAKVNPSTKTDPVYALIAAYEQAEHRHGLALEKLERIETKALAREKNGQSRAYPSNQITSDAPRFYLWDAYDFGSDADIEKHVRHYLHEAAFPFGPKVRDRVKKMRSAAEGELRRMLKAHVVAHSRRRDLAGITAAKEAVEKAGAERSLAMRRLCSAKPRTAAGVVALIKFFDQHFGNEINSYADGRSAGLFKTLASAVSDVM